MSALAWVWVGVGFLQQGGAEEPFQRQRSCLALVGAASAEVHQGGTLAGWELCR